MMPAARLKPNSLSVVLWSGDPILPKPTGRRCQWGGGKVLVEKVSNPSSWVGSVERWEQLRPGHPASLFLPPSSSTESTPQATCLLRHQDKSSWGWTPQAWKRVFSRVLLTSASLPPSVTALALGSEVLLWPRGPLELITERHVSQEALQDHPEIWSNVQEAACPFRCWPACSLQTICRWAC